MKFNDYLLTELFNSDISIDVENTFNGIITYFTIDGVKYIFQATQIDSDVYVVQFTTYDAYSRQDPNAGSFLTNLKHQYRVFSGVKKSLLELDKRKHPEYAIFAAKKSERTRVSVYRKISKLIVKNSNYIQVDTIDEKYTSANRFLSQPQFEWFIFKRV